MTAVERSRSSVFFCRHLKLRPSKNLTRIVIPAGERRFWRSSECARKPADRHLCHQAAKEVRLRQQLGVNEVAVGLNGNTIEDGPTKELERARRVPETQA